MGDRLELKNIVHNMDTLRTRCTPVDKIDDDILENLSKMLEIMYSTGGVGLAANQVGLTQRLVVIDLQESGIKKPILLINPEILERSEKMELGLEGCLSVPVSEKSNIQRSVQVRARYLDQSGKEIRLEATGLLAVCLQHELDHLDGILYIDHLSKIKRDFIMKKAEDNLRQLERAGKFRR
jgi:peptide deformylase